MTECPTCEQDGFSSRRYMRSHHKQVHGESISGFEYTCEWCGGSGIKSQIDDRDAHQFCSTECYHEWRVETLVGEQSPVWQGRTVVVKCDQCGESVEKQLIHIENNKRVFCSNECHAQHMSGRYDDPAFTRKSYGPNWAERRRERIHEDGHKCVVCGVGNSEHKEVYGAKLHVHHIIPIRKFAANGELDYEKANRLDNLITMCVSCHGKWEGIPIRPEVEHA